MSKKMMTLALALTFAVATAGVSFAKDATCEVKSIDGSTVVLDCKDVGELTVGAAVKVKASKKKAVEGC
jgi:hypothetical protein